MSGVLRVNHGPHKADHELWKVLDQAVTDGGYFSPPTTPPARNTPTHGGT